MELYDKHFWCMEVNPGNNNHKKADLGLYEERGGDWVATFLLQKDLSIFFDIDYEDLKPIKDSASQAPT